MQLITVLFKMGILYFLIIVAYRLMGKRRISELSIMDVIVFLLLSNIITSSITNNNQSFIYLTIVISFIIALQVVMTYISSKMPSLKYMFDSKPSVLISKGKLDFKEMIKRRYSIDDLLIQLRAKSIKNIEDIEYAILENNGRISTFGYNKNDNDIPLPIVLDGKIQYVTLKLLHKDEEWIHRVISREQITLNNIFYAFYKQGKLYIIKNES